MLTELKEYNSTKSEYIDKKCKLLDNAGRFYNGQEMVVKAFKNEIVPFYHGKGFEDKDEDKNVRDEYGLIDYNKLNRLISFKKKRHQWWFN